MGIELNSVEIMYFTQDVQIPSRDSGNETNTMSLTKF